MLVSDGDSKTDGRARTGPSHYSPLVLTLVLSTAIVVPSLPSLLSGLSLSDEWRARFFDTFGIYRPSEREGEGVLEKGSIREWMGVKEGRPSMCPMSSGLE